LQILSREATLDRNGWLSTA